MELIVDRLLLILEAKLPALIATSNTFHATVDETKWGVPLTLYVPNEYRYGPVFDLAEPPSLQVFGVQCANSVYGYSDPMTLTLSYKVALFLKADAQEPILRMLDRYSLLLAKILSENIHLAHPVTKEDELVQSGQIVEMDFEEVSTTTGESYDTITFTMEYKILITRLYQGAGIY